MWLGLSIFDPTLKKLLKRGNAAHHSIDLPTWSIWPPTSTRSAMMMAAMIKKRMKLPKVMALSALSFGSAMVFFKCSLMDLAEPVSKVGPFDVDAVERFCLGDFSPSNAN